MFSTFIKKVATAIVATTIVSAFSISAYADDENVSSDVTNVISEDVENETPEMEPTIISNDIGDAIAKIDNKYVIKTNDGTVIVTEEKENKEEAEASVASLPDEVTNKTDIIIPPDDEPEPTPEPSEENPHTGLDSIGIISISLFDLLPVLALIFGAASVITLVALRKKEETISTETATVSVKKEKPLTSYHVRKAEVSSPKANYRGTVLKNKSNAKPYKKREQRT